VTGIICLIAVHVAIVFLLYGSRGSVRSFAVPSEFVVFLFPAGVAFTGYYFLLRARAVRVIPPWVAAFLLTLLSFSLSLLLPFNIYGT
jgi:hypothetical protein